MNFGKGLAQYLHAEETLAALNFAPDSFERRESKHYSKDVKASKSSFDSQDVKASFDSEAYSMEPRTYYIQDLPKFSSAF